MTTIGKQSGQSHFFLHFNFFLLSIPTFWGRKKNKPRTKLLFKTKYFTNYIMRNDIPKIIVATNRKPTKLKLFYNHSLSSLMHPLLHVLY